MDVSGPSTRRRDTESPFDRLPDAVILQILKFVPGNRDFLDYRAVCRAWRALSYQAECLYHPFGGCNKELKDRNFLPVCEAIPRLMPALKKLHLDVILLEPSFEQIARCLPLLEDLRIRRVTKDEGLGLPADYCRFESLHKLWIGDLTVNESQFYELLKLCPRLEGLRIGRFWIKGESSTAMVEINCPELRSLEIFSFQYATRDSSYADYLLPDQILLNTPLLETLKIFKESEYRPLRLELTEHQLSTLSLATEPPLSGEHLHLPKVAELTLRTPNPSWSGHYRTTGGWERVLQTMVDPCPSLRVLAIPQGPPTLPKCCHRKPGTCPRTPDPHPCGGNLEPQISMSRFSRQLKMLEKLEIDRDLFGNLKVTPSCTELKDQFPCLLKCTASLGAPLTQENVNCLKWILDNAPALKNMHVRVRDFKLLEDTDALSTLADIGGEYPAVNFVTF